MMFDGWRWLRTADEPDVLVAQYRGLRRQVPLLYALLIVNSGAVAYTHFPVAPDSLTVGAAGLLIAVCVWRLIGWVTTRDEAEIAIGKLRGRLRQTTMLAGLFGLTFIFWSLRLDHYGGPLERAHIALFIAVTVIGCIFCLALLPAAALLVTVTVTVPYLIYYLSGTEPVMMAVAVNMALVTGVMLWVVLNSFSSFVTAVRSRAVLAAKQMETERLGAENAKLAHTDMLTGLPNRRFFFARLHHVVRDARGRDARFAVGILDLDRFKPVNDVFGHVTGDRVLAEVGQRLAALASSAILIARLGGDEFGVLVTEDADAARDIGQRLCAAVAQPFRMDDQHVALGCTGGFAIFPDAGTTAHGLFDRSDYALYHAKLAARGGCVLFSPEHETAIRSERAIEAALQTADLDAELSVRFQPIMCLQSGAVLGVEALARWESPQLGPVPPDRFIAMAERIGITHGITTHLFGKALAQLPLLPTHVGLSFNLSAQDIASPRTIAQLVEAIRGSGFDPARITFELTETTVVRDFQAALEAIGTLRVLGSRIALDDFGTGYSSLSYLRQLPLDKVKVDRSFVTDMDEAAGRKILAAINGLCVTLGLDCIVEGVETDAQLATLRQLGYRAAQGYLFARPMTAAAFMIWYNRLDAAARRPAPAAARDAA